MLGRGADFDPQSDSIVRVEMGRLRTALDLYYASEGAEDSVRFEIAKGGYRPKIAARASPGAEASVVSVAPPAPRRWLRLAFAAAGIAAAAALAAIVALRIAAPNEATEQREPGPVIVVAPVVVSTDRATFAGFGPALQTSLAAAMAEFDWLSVAIADGGPMAASEPAPASADYLLRATAEFFGDAVTLRALLIDARRGVTLWSRSVSGSQTETDFAAVQQQLVESIAVEASRPFGIIAAMEGRRRARGGTLAKGFGCYLDLLVAMQSAREADWTTAKACHDRLAPGDRWPGVHDASLALIELDAWRNLRDAAASPERARALSDMADRVDPSGWTQRLARFEARLCASDAGGFMQAGGAALAASPHVPILLGSYASELLATGLDVPTGRRLYARWLALNPRPKGWLQLGAAIDAMREGRPAEGAALLAEAETAHHPLQILTAVAVRRSAGDAAGAAMAEARLAELGHPTAEARERLLARSCWGEATTALLAPHLRAAP